MAKGNKSNRFAIIILGILFIVALAFAILGTYQNSSTNHQLNQLNNEYTQLQTNYTALQTSYNKQSLQLNAAEYNLTNPVTEILYSQKTVNIPPEVETNYFNTTYQQEYSQYNEGQYNFTFYAPSAGYILFNETNTGVANNFTSSGFVLYISTETPYYYTDVSGVQILEFNRYIAPYTTFAPQQSKTVMIPVQKGTNNVLFENFNLQGITVTFNMEYVGSHNS